MSSILSHSIATAKGRMQALYSREHVLSYENSAMNLGARIKRRREELGLQQIDLARRVGISQPSLSNIESGKTKSLRAATLVGLARALKTTTRWIMTGRGPHEEDPILTEEDARMFEAWLSLTDNNRKTAILLVESLADSQKPEESH